ncbi:MAG: LysR family transcriptional regulator [Verrucomicrobiota bacterium]
MNPFSTLTFRQIQCFLEVCRDFHFSNAAERLGLTQPPVSRNIQELESALGTKLFNRNPKKVELTPSGRAFLEEVYQLPILLNRAIDSARKASNGETATLRIGFFGAILGDALLGVFHAFRKRFPKIRLKLIDDTPAHLIEALSKEQIDAAFLGLDPTSLPANLERQVWRTERLFACVPKDHPFAARKSVTPAAIAKENLIALSPDAAPTYYSHIQRFFQNEPHSPRITSEANSVPSMLSMIVSGAGLGLLPQSAISAAASQIASVPIRSSKSKLGNTLVYRKNIASESLAPLLQTLEGFK